MYLLFPDCGDLDELTADFYGHLDLASRFGQSRDWLKDVSCIGDYADSLFWQVKLTQMEMSLEILQTSNQMIVHIAGIEDAGVVLGGYTKHASKTFSECAIHVVHIDS